MGKSIPNLSTVTRLGSIWRRGCFRFTQSTGRARPLRRANSRATN